MTTSKVVRQSVAIADPNAPANVLKPNSDGSINISATIGNVSLAPLPVSTLTDHSSTIAAGGTPQSVLTSNPSRKRFIISNPPTESEALSIQFAGSGSGNVSLSPGSSWDENGSTVFTGAIFVVAPTTGHVFAAYEG